MRCLAHGRPRIAALRVGMAQRLPEETVSSALQRRRSGRPITEFPSTQGLIADSQAGVYADRSLVPAAKDDR
jgi:acyl-CoA dehydrogenase